MTVFKNYFKIVKKYIPLILVYTVVFSALAIAFTTTINSEGTFTAVKPKLVIIDHDNTIITKTFKKYIKDYSKVTDMDKEEIKDSLFYREIDAVIEIPKGFSKDLNTKLKLEKLPDSANAVILEQYVNQFFQTVSVYRKSDISDTEISENIIKDLKSNTEVTLINKKANEFSKVTYFYNFLNYIFLAISISIIGIIMSSYLDKNIKKRNLISSYSYKKFNFELLLANSVFTISLWLLFVLISIGLFGSIMFTKAGLLLILNFFIFGIACLALGFLIGSLVKNKEAQNGITNVLALGCSFIAGSFVPQEFLGSFVLGIARVTPSYWFIKNNNEIASISNFNFDSLQLVIVRMLVIIGFAILFFIITNIASRIMRKKS